MPAITLRSSSRSGLLGSITLAGLTLAAGCGDAATSLPGDEASVGSTAQAVSLSMLGADVSSVQRSLDLGASYYDAAGTKKDPLDILKGAGANYVRLRIWNNPVSGYNNKSKVLAYAKTVKGKGMKLLIDFHYSDTWADPNKQYKPSSSPS